MTTPVYCENADLAVEVRALAHDLGLAVSPELSADPLGAAAHASVKTGLAAAFCATSPGPAASCAAQEVTGGKHRVVVALLGDGCEHDRGILADLGFVCLAEVAPALSALALLAAGATRAVHAAARKLSELDRLRLAAALDAPERGAGKWLSLGPEGVALQAKEGAPPLRLGRGADVRQALRAISAATLPADAAAVFEPPQDLAASRDVLFGPPRVLSDPASKAALLPFGLPLPLEELCASPSRAAAEAGRIGFPVRISLASPDLRVWSFPELSVDGVDNAARVRDIYRQLMAMAEQKAPEARVLGVTVTATTLARALIRLTARPLNPGRTLLRVGFCDPHGAVTRDAVSTVLPRGRTGMAQTLERLQGATLLWGDSPPERERTLDLLCDLFSRIGSFVDAFRVQVSRVDLHPVAILVGGGAEVREAAVHVTDAFMRELG